MWEIRSVNWSPYEDKSVLIDFCSIGLPFGIFIKLFDTNISYDCEDNWDKCPFAYTAGESTGSVCKWSLLTPVWCFLLEKYKNFVLFWQECFKSMPSIQYVKRKWIKNKELEVSWPMFLSYEVMLKYFLCIQVLICSIAFCELLCCTILTNIFVGLNHGTHLTVKQYWFLVHNMSVTLFEEGIISAS